MRYENRLRRIDGTWRWVAWTLRARSDRRSAFTASAATSPPTAKRTEALRHAEEALRMAQKMEAIGKLTGGVAHDFNNLLQVIGGNLQLLAERRRRLGEARAARAQRAGGRRARRQARVATARVRAPPAARAKVVNLGRFVRGIDDMLRRALGDGIEIETIVSGGLWNTLVDPLQVENALLNLAINARDAMDGRQADDRSRQRRARRRLRQRNADVTPGQYVMIAVTDTGTGMPPEVRERVFEPFFTTKPEGQGTGLGLSMVYGFVKQSGGHVKIYSELGHGTTIRIYLPRVRQEEDLETNVDTGPAQGRHGNDPRRRGRRRRARDRRRHALRPRLSRAEGEGCAERAGDRRKRRADRPAVHRCRHARAAAQHRTRAQGARAAAGHRGAVHVGLYGERDRAPGRLDDGVELLSKPYTHEALARKVRHVLTDPQRRAIGGRAAGGDSAASGTGDATTDTLRRLRILLVEDDDLVRSSTAELLATFGLDIVEASSETEAMHILREQPVDVMLTDVGLGGASGVDLAIAARDWFPRLA